MVRGDVGEEKMIIIVGAIVGIMFTACVIGAVMIEKPWVRVAMLLLFGLIAFLVLSAYHHAELGKQRAVLIHQYESQKGITNQMTDVANNTSEHIP